MKVLMVIYKIEAGKGSEDGVGYELSKVLSEKITDLTIITRKNNIDKLASVSSFKNVELISVDLPFILSFYKKGGRGIILYYYLWQIAVGIKIFRLQLRRKFNVIHQLNFHATWAPHFIFSRSARIIVGPLTHHPKISYDCWHRSKFLYFSEIIKQWVKAFFMNFDPFLKWSLLRTHHIFLGHNNITGSYKNHKNKISILPQAGNQYPVTIDKVQPEQFTVLYVGRFIDLKGCILAIEALNAVTNKEIKIIFIGSGPLKPLISKSSDKLNIDIIDWLPQDQLSVYYEQASLFLFPSFEGQGLVVAEALSFGTPVLCIENTGPHSVAGNACITVKNGSKDCIIRQLSAKLDTLSKEYIYSPELYQARVRLAFDRAKELSWQSKADTVMEYYNA